MLLLLDNLIGRLLPSMPPSKRARTIYLPLGVAGLVNLLFNLLAYYQGDYTLGQALFYFAVSFVAMCAVVGIAANIFMRGNYSTYNRESEEPKDVSEEFAPSQLRDKFIDLKNFIPHGAEVPNSDLIQKKVSQKLEVSVTNARVKAIMLLAGILSEKGTECKSVVLSKDRILTILSGLMLDYVQILHHDPEERESFQNNVKAYTSRLRALAAEDPLKSKDRFKVLDGIEEALKQLYGSNTEESITALSFGLMAGNRLEEVQGDNDNPLFRALIGAMLKKSPELHKAFRKIDDHGGFAMTDRSVEEVYKLCEEHWRNPKKSTGGWTPKTTTTQQEDKNESGNKH